MELASGLSFPKIKRHRVVGNADHPVFVSSAELRPREIVGEDGFVGPALLIAALMAEGETCVTGAGFISRGYEHICEDLRTLGCRIWQPGTEDLRIYERK